MKKRLLGLMILLISWASALAQHTVSGKVTSSDGSDLPGVSVLVKGTTTGTSTDSDGRFTIAIPNNNLILAFSFIGFTSQEIPVGSQTTIDVSMNEDAQQLNEVDVTALGIQFEAKSLSY